MSCYVILQHPSHNRVYYNLSAKLALSELQIASLRLEVVCTKIEITNIGNVRYLLLETDKNLTRKDLKILSRLSFIFALFKLEQLGEQTCFIPLSRDRYEFVDGKISSLLKYQGKTNEVFTRMMLNVALLSSDFHYDQPIRILDPVAGKGTTLFEGLIYGFDAFGIEVDNKSVHAASTFFKKYLETERFKHQAHKRQLYGKKKSEATFIQEFEFARSKEEFKKEDLRKKVGIVVGNAQEAFKYFKKDLFHLIVGDLPYGIAHKNSTQKNTAAFIRNPFELLKASLEEWHKVLKKGGVVVIAWNAFVLSKSKLTSLFLEYGFEVLKESPYDGFEHMVDKSIKRDILVAKK